MNRHAFVFAALGIFAATSSALAAAAPVPAAPADVALPPSLDRVLRDYERAWRENDATALASLFTEDGFVLQSGQPPVRGRRSIRAAYEGQGGSPLRLRALAYDIGDASGSIIGVYGFGQNKGDTGKFTLTLRRVAGGKWLIHSDMENMNAPPRRDDGPHPTPSAPVPAGR